LPKTASHSRTGASARVAPESGKVFLGVNDVTAVQIVLHFYSTQNYLVHSSDFERSQLNEQIIAHLEKDNEIKLTTFIRVNCM
jgi:hypothetical protein